MLQLLLMQLLWHWMHIKLCGLIMIIILNHLLLLLWILSCHNRIQLWGLLDFNLNFLCLQILKVLINLRLWYHVLFMDISLRFLRLLWVSLILTYAWILIVQIRVEDELVAEYRILRTKIFTHWLVMYVLGMILVSFPFLHLGLNRKEVVVLLSWWVCYLITLFTRKRIPLHQGFLVSDLYHQVIHH